MVYAHALRACVQKTCGFESHSAHISISGCGSVGRAPRLGRGGPQFESGHPDKTWAHSSMVEQFPLKEKVEGSNPSGLTSDRF